MVKKKNKNLFIVLIVIGLFFVMQGKQEKDWSEDNLNSMSRMDRHNYLFSSYPSMSIYGTARSCSEQIDTDGLIKSGSKVSCTGLLQLYYPGGGTYNAVGVKGELGADRADVTNPTSSNWIVEYTPSIDLWFECYECDYPPCEKDSHCEDFGYDTCGSYGRCSGSSGECNRGSDCCTKTGCGDDALSSDESWTGVRKCDGTVLKGEYIDWDCKSGVCEIDSKKGWEVIENCLDSSKVCDSVTTSCVTGSSNTFCEPNKYYCTEDVMSSITGEIEETLYGKCSSEGATIKIEGTCIDSNNEPLTQCVIEQPAYGTTIQEVCGTSQTPCGDGTCVEGETITNCPEDCTAGEGTGEIGDKCISNKDCKSAYCSDEGWFQVADVCQSTPWYLTKKVGQTKDRISEMTTPNRLNIACIDDHECLPQKEDWSAKCIPLANLKNENVIGTTTGFFDEAKNRINKGVVGAGVGAAIGVGACVGSTIGVMLAPVSVGTSAIFTAALGPACAFMIKGGAIGGLYVGMTTNSDKDPLVKALKAEDDSSVGLCVSEEGGTSGGGASCDFFENFAFGQNIFGNKCTTGTIFFILMIFIGFAMLGNVKR